MISPSDPSEVLVSWQVDGVDVDATLTLPSGEGPFPAVVMVAGSGPTDRNWNSPLIPGANGSGALLAQALSGAGFVTLRYDKRPSGPNGQDKARRLMGRIDMQGHVDELAGGVQLLRESRNVDGRRLFALTNSEGCIHALHYQAQAAEEGFAGLILTSAPARVMGDLARAQVAAQLAAGPGGEALLAAYDEAMTQFTAGLNVQVSGDLPEALRNLILGITNPANQPFARELWVTDPAALVAAVTAPVLILIGKKDIQVDWQADGALFERIARNHPNVSVVYAENANHVLKHEPMERSLLTAAVALENYSSAGGDLDAEAVQVITTWLQDHGPVDRIASSVA